MILPLLFTTALLFPAPKDGTAAPPPGMVALPGGRTTIGSSVKEIEKLVADMAEAQTVVRALDAETPQHQMSLPPFAMGVNEVTQEQYAAYVRASGAKPPVTWATAAVEEARKAFFEDLRKRREAGEKVIGLKFDQDKWWDENWEGKEWEVPKADLLRPVVNVDYQDAMNYCRWAGVRMPTEFEFQNAARGKTKDPYPWGDEWEDGKYCATSEMKRVSRSYPVGSFPAGASRDGIFDLAGNVWEWTTSPYKPYPGFKRNEYRVPGQRKKVTVPVPRWDGNQRVVVSGSYQNSRMAARCTVRRGSDRDQRTNALGFRLAATLKPCRDYVEHVWNMDLRNADGRPSGLSYDLDSVMGMDLWQSSPGAEGHPKGYEVITGYEHLALVPRTPLEETGDVPFHKASLVEPQHLGFLTLSFPVLEPKLPAGTYLIAFRGPGKSRAAASEKAGEGDAAEKGQSKASKSDDSWEGILDTSVPNLLFIDPKSGEVVGHQAIEDLVFGKSKGEQGFSPIDKPKKVEDPANPGKTIEITQRWLRVQAELPTRIRRHVLPFSFDLRVGDDYWEKKWRR